MKKSIITLGVILGLAAGSAYASDAEVLKQQDVRACEAQTQQKTDANAEQKQKTCECKIENTDYEALAEAKKNGDLATIQEIKQKAGQSCNQKQGF